jgi:hypothetical protein
MDFLSSLKFELVINLNLQPMLIAQSQPKNARAGL